MKTPLKTAVKSLLLSLITILLYSCGTQQSTIHTPAANQSKQQIETDGEDAVDVFFAPNPDGHPAFVDLISKSTKSINLVMFRITEESDSKALIEASKKRQVKIRILLDREQTLASDVVQKIKAEMIAAGIQVKLGTPAFSITHEKAMTLDDSTALISTVNLTKGFKTTRDIGIITRDQNIINEFNSVFEADWKNSDTGLAVTPPLAVDQLVWSPVSSNQKLNALILESKKTLELYVENFTDNKMADSLIKVAELGVNVRVITPLCSLNPNPLLNIPILKKLLKNKVSVKVMPNPSSVDVPYIHAKSIVVDRKKSYVGSINFSINSLNKAREVGIIFLNALASVKIIEKFDNDWKVAINIPDKPDLAMCQ